MKNPFFKNAGPFNIEKLLSKSDIDNKENYKKDKVYTVSDLQSATKKDLTFSIHNYMRANLCKPQLDE